MSNLLIIANSHKDHLLISSLTNIPCIVINGISNYTSLRLPNDCNDASDVINKYGLTYFKSLLILKP